MYSEDNGFEYISAPKDESSSTDQEEEGSGEMDTPEPVEPHRPLVDIDVSDPYSDGYLLSAKPESDPVPTGVEDVPRERKEVKAESASEGHPRGYLGFLDHLNKNVLDIIYWRNWLYSAGILVALLAFLVTLTINPFIHSLVLALLAMFFVTLTYSAGKVAWDSFHNEPLLNPFQAYLDRSYEIPEDVIVNYAKLLGKEVQCVVRGVIRLVFFADVLASIKFLVVLYIASYFTPMLTVLTSLYLVTVLLFTVPKAYELYQPTVDGYITAVAQQVRPVLSKVMKYVPFLSKMKSE